jgi:hydroxymethylglutaryl-CoA synthase
MSVTGIVAYGTYLPYWRLDRSSIAGAFGASERRGTRSVASFDEDSTSMGVEAARAALRAAPRGYTPEVLVFATASPAYQDKTNATALHAALGLPETTAAYDMGGAVRSAAGALRLAQLTPLRTLVVAADVRTGLPGGRDESDGGDAAVAYAFAPKADPLTEVLATASSSGEFLDRWRLPGQIAAQSWEERFGETAYVPLGVAAFNEACKAAAITADDVDHLVLAGPHARALRSLSASTGVPDERIARDYSTDIGNPGSAQLGLVLADVLDQAEPGAIIVAAELADGADVTIHRAMPVLSSYRERRTATVAAQVAAGRAGLPYASFLSWRGLLNREPPRRPPADSPAGPPSLRHEPWKFAFTATRCRVCGTRHLPPARVCFQCRAVDEMSSESLADIRGTIVTYTIDRLAYSPAPPMIAAAIDFDGGGRFLCEMTDAAPDEIVVGGRVSMTFRRMYTANSGVHNYFWKARLIRESE